MYFYHEGYYDAQHTDATLDALRAQDRREGGPNYEPVPTPAILTWLAIVGIALGVALLAIHALS